MPQFLVNFRHSRGTPPAHGSGTALPKRDKDVLQYGEGLIVNIPLPEPEVAQVVEDVSQNTIIRGTKEYNKDEYIAGAVGGHVNPGFSTMDGRREGLLQGAEAGSGSAKFQRQRRCWNAGCTLRGAAAGRQKYDPAHQRHICGGFSAHVHPSNGSVESSEYKDIQERLAFDRTDEKGNRRGDARKSRNAWRRTSSAWTATVTRVAAEQLRSANRATRQR